MAQEFNEEDALLFDLLKPVLQVTARYCGAEKRKCQEHYDDCVSKHAKIFEARLVSIEQHHAAEANAHIAESTALSTQIEGLQSQILQDGSESRATIANLQTQVDNYVRELSELKATHAERGNQLREEEDRVTGLVAELDTALEKATEMKEQRDELKSIVDQQKDAMHLLGSQIVGLTNSLREANEIHTDYVTLVKQEGNKSQSKRSMPVTPPAKQVKEIVAAALARPAN